MSASLRLGLWFRYLLGSRLAPFVPTPHHVVRRMLALAHVTPRDFVVDLGCGDARLLVAAAKFHGAKGYGVELDARLVTEARNAIAEERLQHMITLEQKDAFEVDLDDATVVALYLSEAGNRKLLPKLRQELRDEARVVSFCWPFAGFRASDRLRVDGIDVFLYQKSALMNEMEK